jgi:hypothetical protein
MIYEVRWKILNDAQQHRSPHHLSTADATDYACALLDRTAVSEISIVDSGGQTVIRMPEIARCHAAKKTR